MRVCYVTCVAVQEIFHILEVTQDLCAEHDRNPQKNMAERLQALEQTLRTCLNNLRNMKVRKTVLESTRDKLGQEGETFDVV